MIRKTVSILFISAFCLLMAGCSLISSTIQYGEGTRCLTRGDYQGAIQHLEKAVEKEPTIAKFQGNLACAYLAIGDLDKAWYHSRKAVLGLGCNVANLFTYLNLHKACVQDKGLEQKGTLLEDVLCMLGEPDSRFVRNDGFIGLLYGRCIMTFYDGKLVESSMELFPEE